MLLYRVAHLDITRGIWTRYDPPEELEIDFTVPALDVAVEVTQAEHRKRVESVKNGLAQLAEKMRMPG